MPIYKMDGKKMDCRNTVYASTMLIKREKQDK